MTFSQPMCRDSTATIKQKSFQVFCIFISALLISHLYGGTSHGDDTFIYMTYVQNFLDGYGFVFNKGEPSFGVTSALWTLVMAPIADIFGNTISVWKATSSSFFALAVTIFFILVRGQVNALKSLVFATILIFTPHTLRWSSSGMENGLSAMLVITSSFTYIICSNGANLSSWKYRIFAALIFSTLPFARPEMAVLSGIFTVGLAFIIWRRFGLSRAGAFLLIYCVFMGLGAVLTHEVFGSVIPQTAEAKSFALVAAYPTYGALQSLKIIVTGASAFFILAALFIFRRLSHMSFVIAALMAQAAIGFLFLAWSNHLVSTRYDTHLSFPLLVSSLLWLAGALPSLQTRTDNKIVGGAFAVQLLISFGLLAYMYPATRTSEEATFSVIANRFDAITGDNSRIATHEVGAFAFFSKAYIIDLIGLTDRASLKIMKEIGGRKKAMEDILDRRRATHLVTYDESCQHPIFRRLTTELVLQGRVERNLLSDNWQPKRPHICIFQLGIR
jgi:arabinofuranosyltransferase